MTQTFFDEDVFLNGNLVAKLPTKEGITHYIQREWWAANGRPESYEDYLKIIDVRRRYMECGYIGNKGTTTCPQCFEKHHFVAAPDLTGRIAKCTCCKSEVPSSFILPFFRFRGTNSYEANERCVCNYYKVAHGQPHLSCPQFKTHGTYQHDEYFCGCKGFE